MRTYKRQHCSMKRLMCAHVTAHCPHIITFLTNLRVNMVHEHVFTCNATLYTVNFLPKSTKCVSNVMSRIDRQLLMKYFLFSPTLQMLTSRARQSKLPAPAVSISFFRHGASVFVTTSKILLLK